MLTLSVHTNIYKFIINETINTQEQKDMNKLFFYIFRKLYLDQNMSKNGPPPPYGFVPPQSAPPSYAQAVGGVQPTSPFTPHQQATTGQTRIVTTVVPIGPQSTHMICPSCHSEMNTQTRTEPGLIAYISGFVIAMLG